MVSGGTSDHEAGIISDKELWACALAVLNQHEGQAPAFAAERIGALEAAADAVGVNVWLAIADRINQLVFDMGSEH